MEITILTRYFNTNNGGIGRYSKELLTKLLESEHTVNPVQTLAKSGAGYAYYTYIHLFKKLKTFNKGSDIYHALTPMEAIYTPKERTVTTFHDLIPILHPESQNWHSDVPLKSVRSSIGKELFRKACKKASKSEKIICNSNQTKREIHEEFDVPKNKMEVIRLGINQELTPLEVDSDNYRVGTLSYLSPRKRVRTLIKSFKDVNNKNARLIIGGKGEMLTELKKLSKEDSRIIFRGYIPENNINHFYNSLDVFVFPTKLEGYGLPAVEAMATGTPVITLKDSLMPEDVKKKTYTVAKEDLSSVLENKSWDVDIRKGLEFADLHNWDRNFYKTNRIYKEVFDG